jgi:hypothetical protein
MFRLFSRGPAEEKASKRLPIRLGMALIAVVGMLLAPLALAASATTEPHAATPATGTYVALSPFRIVDTRTGATDPATYAGKTLGAAGTLPVQVTGVGTTPVPTGASAVVLNVTAVVPTAANGGASGFVTVYPGGGTLPTVSNLNTTPGTNVANLVTVGLSSTGGVSIYNASGSTDIVVDVEGYYTSTPATNGYGLYNAMSPVRDLGTLALGAPVAAGQSVPVTVAGGSTSVPANASAVVLNVTAAFGTDASFLSVYPAPALTTEPPFSNLNFSAGQVVANRVTVPVGTGGVVEVYNHTGTVNVDVDVDGYYTGTGGIGSDFTALAAPVRVADTRTASLVGTETPIAAAKSESFSLATTASGIPTTATAVAANVTVVAGSTSGYLSVYPAPVLTTQPDFSDVNWVANDIVPNFTIADTNGTGSVEVYNSYGTINLVVDVFGYFTAVTAGPLMVSAVVTDTTISITYNEGVSCPATGADAAFVYDWTGAASGGTVTGCTTSSTNADVLVLTGSGLSPFILPSSTGGTLTYTAGEGRSTAIADTTSISVYETGTTTSFSPTQTLAVTAAVAPAMVSAYTNTDHVVITYNEDVTCVSGDAADFVYAYTGSATGFEGATPTVTAACSGSVLTLTDSAGVEAPLTGAYIVYTEPTASSSPVLSTTSAVYATGAVPTLYAASQTLSGTEWATPAITAAAVSTSAGTITLTYTTGDTMLCGTAQQSEFVYSNGGSPAYPSTCIINGSGQVVLGAFMTASSGGTAATLVLPGASDTIVYTSPATPATATELHASNVFPQFPATQTFSPGATAAPVIQSFVPGVSNAGGTTLTVTYQEAVSCPATGADADFVYDSAYLSSGGSISSCASGTGDTLVLSGLFNASTGSGTLVYTAPAASTTSNAVYAAGSASAFAATQTVVY